MCASQTFIFLTLLHDLYVQSGWELLFLSLLYKDIKISIFLSPKYLWIFFFSFSFLNCRAGLGWSDLNFRVNSRLAIHFWWVLWLPEKDRQPSAKQLQKSVCFELIHTILKKAYAAQHAPGWRTAGFYLTIVNGLPCSAGKATNWCDKSSTTWTPWEIKHFGWQFSG